MLTPLLGTQTPAQQQAGDVRCSKFALCCCHFDVYANVRQVLISLIQALFIGIFVREDLQQDDSLCPEIKPKHYGLEKVREGSISLRKHKP
ncbi:hypothetical protein AYI74_03835 [Shewanella algae]|nr:hypothetical protein AYI77_11125 [Shewanella algae]TWU69567.1 hypothetical protein AYI74_03835 [Shewanella algae]